MSQRLDGRVDFSSWSSSAFSSDDSACSSSSTSSNTSPSKAKSEAEEEDGKAPLRCWVLAGPVAGWGVSFLSSFGRVGIVVEVALVVRVVALIEVTSSSSCTAAERWDRIVQSSSGVCVLCNLGPVFCSGSASLTNNLGLAIVDFFVFIAETKRCECAKSSPSCSSRRCSALSLWEISSSKSPKRTVSGVFKSSPTPAPVLLEEDPLLLNPGTGESTDQLPQEDVVDALARLSIEETVQQDDRRLCNREGGTGLWIVESLRGKEAEGYDWA
jgi:hypothetical protein